MNYTPEECNMKEFQLDDEEIENLKEFMYAHKDCKWKSLDDIEDVAPMMYFIIMSYTTVGSSIEVTCGICGKSEDISSMKRSNW